MTSEEFKDLIKRFRDAQDNIMWMKNREYTRGKDDVIANFVRTADAVGITPAQAWGNMFSKHVDAIFYWIKKNISPSEGIQSRIIDACNLLLLLLPIIEEINHGKTSED